MGTMPLLTTPTKVVKDIRHGDTCAANTWLTAANAWINVDAVFVIHDCILVFASIAYKIHLSCEGQERLEESTNRAPSL